MEIAFVGLTSATKSIAINAIVGEMVAQTGGSAPKKYGPCTSDDGIPFTIVDFPAEDSTDKFDDIMMQGIVNADVIFWVSDINTEYTEYNKIDQYLKVTSLFTGRGYQLAFMLIVCDTTDADMITKVKETFETVVVFNAHGRIGSHASSLFNLAKFEAAREQTHQMALFRNILQTQIIDKYFYDHFLEQPYHIEYGFFRQIAKKCCHGNNVDTCDKSMRLCYYHGYCDDDVGDECLRQICTDGSSKLPHSCHNYIRNGRNVGICIHGTPIGECRGCYEQFWMYCHHGFIQWHCDTCRDYMPQMPDPIDISKLTNTQIRKEFVAFLRCTSQKELDAIMDRLSIKHIDYDEKVWNYFVLLFYGGFTADEVGFGKTYRNYILSGDDQFYDDEYNDAHPLIDLPHGRIPFDSRTIAPWTPVRNMYNAKLMQHKPNIRRILSPEFISEIDAIRNDSRTITRDIIMTILARPELYVSLFA